MNDPISIASFLAPILIFLAAAVTAVPLFRLAGLGAVVGYLAAGIAIGPTGFSFITDPSTMLNISEFGVVLLLFIIGLELKPSRLFAMRRDIALMGTSQMLITGGIFAFASVPLLGLSPDGAIVAGISFAFASTAIALQLLDERGAMQSQFGRRAFAVLLFQDMAVVPVLALIPILGPRHAVTASLTDEIAALARSVEALSAVVFVGRYALNPFFRLLASTGSREVMVAAALLVVLGAALVMGSAGMSMALGAFLAGVLLSESNFRHQLEADIEPFRSLLMGLFFMSVGMSIEGSTVVANAGLMILCAALILPLKAIIVFALLRLTGSTDRGALEAAGALTPAGEFSFIVFPLAAAEGMMTRPQADFLSALAALTMFIGPLLAKILSYAMDHRKTPLQELEAEIIPDDDKNSILVIGFSRFAQIALQVLLAEDVNVTVIDNSVERIRNAARFGFKVYYGDGTRLDVLRAAGAADALVIAVCVDRKAADTIVEMAKANFPLARVHARSFDRIHAIELLEKGADYQIRETFESALVFGGATLDYLLDDPEHVAEVVAFVRRRDEARFDYQLAKGSADGLKPVPAHILPEPLFKPLKKTRALSPESQDIVEGHDVGL
jgi:CPA2 family monovalent cation:H+ antiporter-2/glutathione-regulated potassium-efflux system protein KefB